MVALEPHQLEALRKIHQLDGRAGLFIDRGGGKTRVALMYAALRKCKRILVICPFSVPSIWESELTKMGNPYRSVDLTGFASVALKRQALSRFGDGVVLVNYESYWRQPLRQALIDWKPDAVILDEAHRVRHRTTKLSKFAHVFAQRGVPVRLALTGTPITNGLQDAYSIFRFVNPHIFGLWSNFENQFIIRGGYLGYEIKGYRNEEVVERIISENSFQWEGDMPNPPDVAVRVRLTPRTRKMYDQLKKHSILKLEETGTAIVAPMVLTLILRLQQLTSGFGKDDEDKLVHIGEEKADAAMDLIEDALAEHKRVVLFALFLHDLDVMEERLQAAGYSHSRIDGSKSSAERKEAMQALETGDSNVLLVQIGSGSEGIDLSAASVGIFYSVDHSVMKFLQAKGRLTGALRQRHPVVFYHLLCDNTIDQKIYEALTSKMDVATRVTDMTYALKLIDQ